MPTRPKNEPTWTPEPEVTNAAREITIAVPPPAAPTLWPTVDIASIPNMDRPHDSQARSRTEQLAGCLSFRVEPISEPGWPGKKATRAKVHARNRCTSWIPAEDTWFEAISRSGTNGSTIGREVAHFYEPIAPMEPDVETLISIDCPPDLPGGCTFSAEVWWAAGGGRKPE